MNQNHILTFPLHLLRDHLRVLARQPTPWVDCPAGVSWLKPEGGKEVIAARFALPTGTTIRLGWMTDSLADTAPVPPARITASHVAVMQVGRRLQQGHARAWLRISANHWKSVGTLNLPGPGMPSIRLLVDNTASLWRQATNHNRVSLDTDRWSRTIGALGLEVWKRVAGLRVGFVGLGRVGSLLLRDRVRFGVGSVVLVDPDHVEHHNLGEGCFDPAEVGQFKVHAWENRLALTYPDAEVIAVPHSVTDARAIEGLKGCDLIFSSPDHPGARLAAGAIAAAYARPLLDVGTLIHRSAQSVMGLDVRLITPERCLLCFGGVRGESEGRALLASPDRERNAMVGRHWRAERPGSLYSLNQLAASVGARIYEDFVAGRLRESVWCHLEFASTGRIEISYPAPPTAISTPCACRLSGWGDVGLSHFAELMESRTSWLSQRRI